MNFIAFGGDGGTYDIGLQSLSGAMERGHHMLYVCYDNEAYMNTGIQRSSATPIGAHTTTAPAGSVKQGKEQNRKDLTEIMVAHNIPYVAQTTPCHWKDLATKVEKALNCGGPAFINVLMPCTVGWHFESEHRRADREGSGRDQLLAALRGRERQVHDQLQAEGAGARSRTG